LLTHLVLRIFRPTTTAGRGRPLPIDVNALEAILFEKLKRRFYEDHAVSSAAGHVGPGGARWTLVIEFPAADTKPDFQAMVSQFNKFTIYVIILWVLQADLERSGVNVCESQVQLGQAIKLDLRWSNLVARPCPRIPLPVCDEDAALDAGSITIPPQTRTYW
jgi:hypothetical protein